MFDFVPGQKIDMLTPQEFWEREIGSTTRDRRPPAEPPVPPQEEPPPPPQKRFVRLKWWEAAVITSCPLILGFVVCLALGESQNNRWTIFRNSWFELNELLSGLQELPARLVQLLS